MKLSLKLFYNIAFWVSFIGLIAIISNFGFPHTDVFQRILDLFYFVVLGVGIVSTVTRYLQDKSLFKRKVVVFDALSVLFSMWIFYMYLFVGVPFETDLLLENPIWVKIAVALTFIREFSELKINFKRTVLNPAQLFILSFLFIIFVG